MAVCCTLWNVVMTAMIVFATCATSMARETKSVPGLWVFNDAGGGAGPKMGVIENKGDAHPSFLFADCEQVRNRVQINLRLDIDPKKFYPFLQNDEWIWLRISVGNKTADALVVAIELNEMGPYSWILRATPNRDALELLTVPGPAHLSLGRLINRQFDAQETYELPNQEREAAAVQFVNACFGPTPPTPRLP